MLYKRRSYGGNDMRCFTPSNYEKQVFVEMIKKEILYSQQFEDVLTTNRSRNRKRYFMLQKEFHLAEMDKQSDNA